MPLTLVWFHRDLRLTDHPALYAAAERGPILPVYIWSPDEEGSWSPGGASRWWLHYSLEALKRDLAAKGLALIVRQAKSSQTALKEIIKTTGADALYWNRRYDPSLRPRDAAIEQAFSKNLEVRMFTGDLLFEPGQVMNQSGKPFQVFTPFWNRCGDLPPPAKPLPLPKKLMAYGQRVASEAVEDLNLLPTLDWAAGFRKDWTPGERGAQQQLKRFIAESLEAYPQGRDRPDQEGTSRLSPHLHFGEISPRQVWAAAPGMIYRKEIGWRDFAHHILFHFPETCDVPLRPEFRQFPWLKTPLLKAWQKGKTGYPVVDAGMRQLWTTGWMHNRVRMVVASFLVKDLLVSWKEGARWFWDTLVDADLANNSFNWQWAGGCGADAAPFFRIFNPTTQGERFDPQGLYVRRWVPELARLPDEWIHEPWKAPEPVLAQAGIVIGKTYPAPIVDHAFARVRALQHFKRL